MFKLSSTIILFAFVRLAVFMPAYEYLVGLDERKVSDFIAHNGVAPIPNPPAPLARCQYGLKLSNDPAHLFITPDSDDLRGPCPAFNTLANHGLCLNLGNVFAKFLVYQAFLMNGKPLTNLISIGMHTPLTGQNPPNPALVGGLSQHGTFEGNIDSLLDFSSKYGSNGTYDLNAIAKFRFQRLQHSIMTNPELDFTAPRILSAYSEAVFPLVYFIIEPMVGKIFAKHPFTLGVNHGKNNYKLMPNTPALSDFCGIYKDIVFRVIPAQYPRPSSQLKDALNKNLGFLFGAVKQ
ncbi:hypothetical protein M422DRAFT_28333 [Sphaerobolus stellatus SS14]|nr:hypothetical protein M422DRAFT_28333 [Sphaerobolus stellatus SS14]